MFSIRLSAGLIENIVKANIGKQKPPTSVQNLAEKWSQTFSGPKYGRKPIFDYFSGRKSGRKLVFDIFIVENLILNKTGVMEVDVLLHSGYILLPNAADLIMVPLKLFSIKTSLHPFA